MTPTTDPITLLMLGYPTSITHLLREFHLLGMCGSDGMRALRAVGAQKCPGMQPVGAESWYIPGAAQEREKREGNP